MKKRVKLEAHENCVRCGEVLPSGMTAYALSGDDGTGYLHYGKCAGTLRSEKNVHSVELQKMEFKDLLRIIRGDISASETVRGLAMKEIEKREKKFREAIEGALKEIEEDERLGYPTATVDINAPLALIQCGLQSQVNALKYVLIALDVKDGKQ